MNPNDLFQAIFASSPLGTAVLDERGRLFRSNPALQRMLGRSEHDLASLTIVDLLDSEDAVADAGRIADVCAGRRHEETVERPLRRVEGGSIWGRLRMSHHRGTEQSFVVVTVEDLSASRVVEETKRDIEHRLGERIKELTALHQTAELILRRRGTWEERLSAVAALLPPAMQYPEITTGCIRYRGQTFATAGHGKTTWVLNVPWTMADGTMGEIEVAYHAERVEAAIGPFLLEERALLTSLAEMLQTSLDRDHAADALREANERFRLALNTASMGIWEWDVTRNTVCWSEPLPSMEGLNTQMLPFGTYFHLMHPEDFDYVSGRLERAAAGEDDLRSLECRLRRHDGSWRNWLGSGWIERNSTGRATRILIALIDVTERRAMEERLRQAQKVEALGQVAGGVAHDFNNILAVLFSGIFLLRDEVPANHEWRETIDELLNACERGQALTRQLLAFSRKTQLQVADYGLVADLFTTVPELTKAIAAAKG